MKKTKTPPQSPPETAGERSTAEGGETPQAEKEVSVSHEGALKQLQALNNLSATNAYHIARTHGRSPQEALERALKVSGGWFPTTEMPHGGTKVNHLG